jgi:hypothetical protein
MMQRRYYNQELTALPAIWYDYSPWYPEPGHHVANDPHDLNKDWGPGIARCYEGLGGTDPNFLRGSIGNLVGQIQAAYAKAGKTLPPELTEQFPTGPEFGIGLRRLKPDSPGAVDPIHPHKDP